MKRIQQKHIGYKKKKKKIRSVKFFLPSPFAKRMAKERRKVQKKTFSPYPYIMTVSYYKSNVFFTVADIEGHTKI
jgi:hypothetical protein